MNRTSTLAGGIVLSTATVAALGRTDALAPLEAQAFKAVNRASGRLRPVLWPTMQLGNGLMAVAVPVAVVASTRPNPDWKLAMRGAAAAFGGWQLAKAVKAVVKRGRPAQFFDDVEFRDGEPDGLGFVSGHTTVATAVAAVFAPLLPRPARVAAWMLAGAVGVARIYVGAHLPLDVLGGAGLGAAWGGLLSPNERQTQP